MKVHLYALFFWFFLVSIVIYLLFFNGNNSVSHQNLKWSCGDDLCKVSFYVLNKKDVGVNFSYGLFFISNKENTAYSFRNFGVGKTHMKEISLKKTDHLYLLPFQSERVFIEVPVDFQPSDIYVTLKYLGSERVRDEGR